MPVFEKAICTLWVLLDELQLHYLLFKIGSQILQIDAESVLKILVRIKVLMPCREKLIKIFQSIAAHEKKLLDLNMAVMQGSEEIMVDKIQDDKTDSQIHLDNE